MKLNPFPFGRGGTGDPLPPPDPDVAGADPDALPEEEPTPERYETLDPEQELFSIHERADAQQLANERREIIDDGGVVISGAVRNEILRRIQTGQIRHLTPRNLMVGPPQYGVVAPMNKGLDVLGLPSDVQSARALFAALQQEGHVGLDGAVRYDENRRPVRIRPGPRRGPAAIPDEVRAPRDWTKGIDEEGRPDWRGDVPELRSFEEDGPGVFVRGTTRARDTTRKSNNAVRGFGRKWGDRLVPGYTHPDMAAAEAVAEATGPNEPYTRARREAREAAAANEELAAWQRDQSWILWPSGDNNDWVIAARPVADRLAANPESSLVDREVRWERRSRRWVTESRDPDDPLVPAIFDEEELALVDQEIYERAGAEADDLADRWMEDEGGYPEERQARRDQFFAEQVAIYSHDCIIDHLARSRMAIGDITRDRINSVDFMRIVQRENRWDAEDGIEP